MTPGTHVGLGRPKAGIAIHHISLLAMTLKNSGSIRAIANYLYPPATYAAAHDASSATSVIRLNNSNFEVGQIYQYYGGDHGYYVYRGGLVFDTSIIPDSATIIETTLLLYGQTDGSDTDFDIVIVSGADLADTFVAADYGELLDDTISRGSINTSSFITNGYNKISLNAIGIGEISKTGNTRFGLRSSRDIDSITPKLNSGTLYREYVLIYGSDATWDKVPKLEVSWV